LDGVQLLLRVLCLVLEDFQGFYQLDFRDCCFCFEARFALLVRDLLREQFNSGVKIKRHALKWDTVIEEKSAELGRFLIGKAESIDFVSPTPELDRSDSTELRARISPIDTIRGWTIWHRKKHASLLAQEFEK
jgi:hypothetical protein